jgi:hypothetical protein
VHSSFIAPHKADKKVLSILVCNWLERRRKEIAHWPNVTIEGGYLLKSIKFVIPSPLQKTIANFFAQSGDFAAVTIFESANLSGETETD